MFFRKVYISEYITTIAKNIVGAPELRRLHHILFQDIQIVKNTIFRLEQQLQLMKNTIQPMFPEFPICSIKEAEEFMKLISKRIEEYSHKDYFTNLFRV